MKRIAQIEFIATIVALVLAVGTGLYLAVTTFNDHETCYGISSAKIVCHAFSPHTADGAQATARMAVVLAIVWAIFVVGVLASLWQMRAADQSTRTTAFMILVVCVTTALGLTLPALDGVGLFFIPSVIVLVAATFTGLAALFMGRA